MAAAAALAVVAMLVLGFGLVREFVFRPGEVVAEVHGEQITLAALAERMSGRMRRYNEQIAMLEGLGGAGSGEVQSLMLQRELLPHDVLDEMVDDLLLRQEASRRGLTVTTEEVEAEIRRSLALQASLRASFEATPEPTASGQSSATPTPVPTLTDEQARQEYDNLLRQLGETDEGYRRTVEADLLRRKVQEAIGQERVPASQEQVHVRMIVAPDRDRGRELLERLRGGAPFEAVARAESQDKATAEQGGDLGWLPRGIRSPQFDEVVFALEVGQLSDLVQLPEGVAILQVVERAERPLSETHREQLVRQAFSAWLAEQRQSEGVRRTLTEEQQRWAIEQATRIGNAS